MRFIYSLLFIGFFGTLQGQQNQHYTMKMLNLFQINPAFAGVSDQLNVFSFYRSQWQSHNGSPTQFNLNASLPFYKLNGGLGVKLSTSFQGVTDATNVDFSYAYYIPWLSDHLSVGISLGIAQFGMNGNEIITPEGTYEFSINHNDPILNNIRNTAFIPRFSLSAFYANDYFDAGIRFADVIAQPVPFEQLVSYNVSRFSDVFFSYYYTLPNGWIWQPSVYIMSNFKQYQIDLSNFIKYGNVFGGIGLRGYDSKSIESLNLSGGIKFNNSYTIAYSYDVSLNSLRKTSEGSHEIMIRYDLNKEINTGRPPKTIYNPRNL